MKRFNCVHHKSGKLATAAGFALLVVAIALFALPQASSPSATLRTSPSASLDFAPFDYAQGERDKSLRASLSAPIYGEQDRTIDAASNGGGDFLPYNKYSLLRENADATRTMRIFSTPINYWNESAGQWQPIDTTIVKLGDVYGVETGVYQAYFYPDHAEVVREGGAVAQVYFLGTNDPGHDGEMTLAVEENRAIYRGVIDLEYIYTNTGLKQNVILYEKPEIGEDYFVVNTRLVFDQAVYAQSEHFTTSEAVEFKNSGGEVIYRLPRPFAFELDNFANQVDGEYEITVSENEALVAIKTPYAWLEQSAYPVVIDPPPYYSDATLDGYITYKNGAYYATDSTSTTFLVGRKRLGQHFVYRGYVSFDTSDIPNADTVISATLYIETTATDNSDTDFNNDVYNVNYSQEGVGSLDSADWGVPGTLEDTILPTASWAADTYRTLAVGQVGIDKTGRTEYQIKSGDESNLPSNNTNAYTDWDSAEVTGITSDPRLDVTYGTVTWASWDAVQPQESFAGSNNMVYMKGTGFTAASHPYTVGYYDGANALVTSDAVSSEPSGNLNSQYYFPTDTGSTAGTWHAVLYDYDVATSPAPSYTANDPNSVIEDVFTVDISAIPEFPMVIAGVAVVALCFGLYYWMRRRRVSRVW